jgi:hypothetical protein
MAYFNSDLSEFIGKQCRKVMTSIDVDILQVKASRRIIRFIESKHKNEKVGDQQRKALSILGKIGRAVNKNHVLFDTWSVEVYIVRSNIPYHDVEIEDLVNFTEFKIIDVEKFKKFLEVEYDLQSNDLKSNYLSQQSLF